MKEIYKDFICLLSCAVNGTQPDKARVQNMDLEQLYRLAKYHSVRAAFCIVLERAGVHNKSLFEAYMKSVRKNIYLDAELAAITSDFEHQGIWYMPLKGSVLKDLYPETGMREMADCDVLFDAQKQYQVMDIMIAHGYSAEIVGKSNHDVYKKPPVLNFELHSALFGSSHAEPLFRYYADVKRRLIKNKDNRCGYHFSDEDFYVYITAHEWKHYSGGGTGMRSLLDCYVYCKAKGGQLDWNYISEQCRQLEIADFERKRRRLAVKVFSSETLPRLTESEAEMLMYYLTAGTYGTVENSIKNKLRKQSKASYILHNLFPNVDYMRKSVSFVERCQLLYPVGIVYRWGRILIMRRKLLKKIIKVMKQNDNRKIQDRRKGH
ncbi:Uncharacterised nucleotidyltransferase [Ruminococcaceae bacterium FB2012]|nr:Uncharacterised nucleotidyltransferase [Ruminococcaceae bacterium FB2012]